MIFKLLKWNSKYNKSVTLMVIFHQSTEADTIAAVELTKCTIVGATHKCCLTVTEIFIIFNADL